jgi:DNA-binding SARP family transcriptional activator
MPQDLANLILRALQDDRLERSELRDRLAREIDGGDAQGSLLAGSALALCISIADDHFEGFAQAVDAVLANLHTKTTLGNPGQRFLADAGELVARWFRALTDPALQPLAEQLVRSLGDRDVDASLRCAGAIAALAYFDETLDQEKIWWVELAMRDVLTEPGLSARLADEWHYSLVRACHICREVARADELRRQRAASKLPMPAAIDIKLALLDARVAIGEGRLELGHSALQRAEPLLDSHALVWAGMWHFYASRLAMLESRLADAMTHARLALRLCTEACYPELWISSYVMQEGQVHVARGSFFDAVPFFERAGRAASGVQADYCWCLAHFARALGQVEAGANEAARRELAEGFDLVHKLAWTDFFRANAKVAARLCALALEHGIQTELVRSIITERQFEADWPDLGAWPWSIRIRTLGRFEIEIDGCALPLRGKGARKPLELLQFVIASGGSDVAASSAIFAVWPELDGDHARSAFTVALHRLRKLLGSDAAVVLELGKLSLGLKNVWVDCLAFESLADQVNPPFTAAQMRAARRAQALYSGHFLHDDEEHAWQAVHRSRLASKFKRVVRALVGHWTAHGEAAAARNLLERAIELDPLAEDLARELIQLLINQGEGAAALAVYERCKAMLAQLLGAQPAPATLQLVARLRASP